MDYLKSRKNSYGALLSGLVLAVVVAFVIYDDPSRSTLVAAGAIGVVLAEGLMYWRWRKQRKTTGSES